MSSKDYKVIKRSDYEALKFQVNNCDSFKLLKKTFMLIFFFS